MGMGRSLSGLRPLFLQHARQIHLPRVEQRKHGILAIEALAILAWCRVFHVERIIESGVNNGRSTAYFRRSGLHVTSVDVNECDCEADEFIQGDGMKVIPPLMDGQAVFIDGPKGPRAIALLDKILDDAAFVSVHDVVDRDQDRFQWVSSNDDEFLEEFSHLIDNPRYPKGTGLGVTWR